MSVSQSTIFINTTIIGVGGILKIGGFSSLSYRTRVNLCRLSNDTWANHYPPSFMCTLRGLPQLPPHHSPLGWTWCLLLLEPCELFLCPRRLVEGEASSGPPSPDRGSISRSSRKKCTPWLVNGSCGMCVEASKASRNEPLPHTFWDVIITWPNYIL